MRHLLFCLMLCATGLSAQDIIRIEYFYNSDPGFGRGIAVPVSPSNDLELALDLELKGLNPGFHTLFVRALDSNGNWSITQQRPFALVQLPDPAAIDIQAIEYFFDRDPGYGMGIPVPFTPGTQLESSFTADLTRVTEGEHMLYVRAMDSAGNWSLVVVHRFRREENQPPAAPKDLSAAAASAAVQLTWVPNSESDLLRYRLYAGTGPNPSTLIDSIAAGSPASFLVRDLTPGKRYYFRLTAVDNAGKQSGFSNEVSAVPRAPNQPPVVAQMLADTTLGLQGASFRRNLIQKPAVFVDADGTPLTFSSLAANPDIATATVSGTWLTVQPKGAGSTTVRVVANDGSDSVETRFAVTVISTNRPPEINRQISAQTLVAGAEPIERDLEASPRIFRDPDGNPMTYSASSSNNPVLVAGIAGTVLRLTAMDVGEAEVTVRAEDNQGGSIDSRVMVQVVAENSNQSPVVENAPLNIALILGGDSFMRNLAGDDPVFSDPDSDSLQFAAATAPQGIVDAEISESLLRVSALDTGLARVLLFAQDGRGGRDSTSFQVRVGAANLRPRIVNALGERRLSVGGVTLVRDLFQIFEDPEGASLTFAAASNDESVAVAEVSSGLLRVRPVSAGNTSVTVSADDRAGGVTESTLDISVGTGNQAPQVNNVVPAQTMLLGNSQFFWDLEAIPAIFFDANGDSLAYTASSSSPSVVAAEIDGTRLSLVPRASGDASISVSASDGDGAAQMVEFSVSVSSSGSNSAPQIAASIADTSLSAGAGSISINLEEPPAVFNDPDGDALTYTASSSDNAVATLSLFGTLLTVAPVAEGQAEINITARDNRGGQQAEQFMVMVSSNRAPEILHSQPAEHEAGRVLVVEAEISDDTGLQEAALKYRRGGDMQFITAIVAQTAGVWQGSIPASEVTSRGVEYFFEAMDLNGLNATTDIFAVPVRIDGVGESSGAPQPGGSAQTAYRLFSVPFTLDNNSARQVLEDDLGTYDPSQWRFFEWLADQSEAEFPNISPFEPGRAFWLIVRESAEVFSGTGFSNGTQAEMRLPLHPQWNLIGNPFNFNIPVANLALTSGAAVDLRAFDGAWSDAGTMTQMQPFSGYAIFNAGATNDTLIINPDLTPPPMALTKIQSQAKWQLRLTAEVQDARDTDNLILINDAASPAWDSFDQPEPPVIGEYVSLAFPHADWQERSYVYAIDARPEPLDGDSWPLRVVTNIRDKVTVTVSGVDSIPSRYQVWLSDPATGREQDMRQNPIYTFAALKDERAKRLRLVVGTAEFINHELETDGIPVTWQLAQNYPNPFNPVTTIRVGIPERQHVQLVIYDMLGREVRRLVDEELAPGYQSIIWDGRNKAGQQVASGIYMYRLQSGKSVRFTQKMLLVR